LKKVKIIKRALFIPTSDDRRSYKSTNFSLVS